MKHTDVVIANRYGAMHQLNVNSIRPRRVYSYGVSLTQPGMTMSMSEVFNRFTRGFPLPVTQAVYTSQDLSALDTMDKFQIVDLQRKVAKTRQVLQDRISTQNRDIAAKQAELDFNAKVDAKAKELFEAIKP